MLTKNHEKINKNVIKKTPKKKCYKKTRKKKKTDQKNRKIPPNKKLPKKIEKFNLKKTQTKKKYLTEKT